MSVVNQRGGCPGLLIETAPGAGECERGDECEALALRADYLSYRQAHTRISTEWGATRRD
jgi:hypothetical protein